MTREEVIEVLVRYGTHTHYLASSSPGPGRRVAKYAVFRRDAPPGQKQLTEPAGHAETERSRLELIADDILKLAGE